MLLDVFKMQFIYCIRLKKTCFRNGLILGFAITHIGLSICKRYICKTLKGKPAMCVKVYTFLPVQFFLCQLNVF